MFRTENSLIDQEFDSIRDKFELEMRKMEEEMVKFRSQLLATSSERQGQTQSVTSSSLSQQISRQQQAAAVASRTASASQSTTSSSARATGEEHQHPIQEGSNISSQSQSAQSLASSQRVSSTITSRTTTTKRRTTTKTIGLDDLDASGSHNNDDHDPSFVAAPPPTAASSGVESSFDHHHSLLNPRTGDHQSWINQLDSPLIKDDLEGQGKMLKLRFDVSQYQPDEIVVKTIDNRLQVHAKREEKTENSSRYLEYNREFLLPEGTDPEKIRSSLSADGVLTVEAPLPFAALGSR